MNMIFESHAHYEDQQFDEDRETLLQGFLEHNIGTVVNVGSSMRTCQETLNLVNQYAFIYGSIGVHPEESDELDEKKMEWLKVTTNHQKIVAIGEIGLDYYWDEPARQIQKKWFKKQIALAREVQLPMIIHSRDAAQDTLDLLKEQDAKNIGGVIHCFSYGVEVAQEFLKMDFYIGVGGVVTFKNAKKLKEVVEAVPIEKILLETDSPYLAPMPNRGQRNSSLNLIYIAEKIAEIKGLTTDEVIEKTEKNAKQMYRLI